MTSGPDTDDVLQDAVLVALARIGSVRDPGAADEEQITTMLVDNPHRFLAGGRPT